MIAEDLGIKLENVTVQMLGNANEHAGTYGGKTFLCHVMSFGDFDARRPDLSGLPRGGKRDAHV